jgi:hypothetical protein
MNLSRLSQFFFASKPVAESTPAYNANPAPADIIELGAQARAFQGIKISWTLSVRFLTTEFSQHEVMVLTTYADQPVDIWVTLDIKTYPDIFYIPTGEEITVKGEISGIQGKEIYLKNCSLEAVTALAG